MPIYDESDFDINRLRKLAGVPATPEVADEVTGYDDDFAHQPLSFEDEDFEDFPEDDFGSADGMALDTDDFGATDDLDAAEEPMDLPITPELGSPELGSAELEVTSHWEEILTDLENQMETIPVGDFKAVINRLQAAARQAESIRSSLLSEGKRSLRDMMAENTNGSMTIGNNQNDAIKAIHARMGGKPQDQQKARETFNNLRRNGVIKPKGSTFTMDAMDDDTFNATINGQGPK